MTTTTAARTHPLDPESSGGLPPTLSGDQSGALAPAGREAKEAIERKSEVKEKKQDTAEEAI